MSDIEKEAADDYRAWLTDEYQRPTLAEVEDHDDATPPEDTEEAA